MVAESQLQLLSLQLGVASSKRLHLWVSVSSSGLGGNNRCPLGWGGGRVVKIADVDSCLVKWDPEGGDSAVFFLVSIIVLFPGVFFTCRDYRSQTSPYREPQK